MKETKWKIPYRTENTAEEKLQQIEQKYKKVETRKANKRVLVENSERGGNTRPPDLPLEKPICRTGSNS